MSVSNTAKIKSQSWIARFRQLSLVKKGVIIVVVLLLIWFVGTRLFGQKNNASQYQTAVAQRGSIISSVSESGAVSADSQVDITSPATGIIKNIYIKNGDSVTAGQKLFEVKATATPQEQASAYATYESALNSYQAAQQTKQSDQATLEKDRQAILDAQNAVNNEEVNPVNPSTKQVYTQLEKDSLSSALTNAQETFTADQTKYTQADTAIAAANAQLNSASIAYQATQDSVVTAPVSGTVANLAVENGNSVIAANNANASNNANSGNGSNAGSGNNNSNASSNTSTSGGSTVLVIGDFSQLSVVAQVNEVDIPKVKVGQNVTISLDAFPNETFVGKVESVDSIGTTNSGVVTYNIYISLISPPTDIKSGMTASVNIQTDRHDNVITVPTAAIQTANDSSYVRVLKNGKVTSVPVTTGLSSDTDTEITSGINEGDVVVTGTNTPSSSSSQASSPFSTGLGGTGRGGGGGAILRGR